MNAALVLSGSTGKVQQKVFPNKTNCLKMEWIMLSPPTDVLSEQN